MSNKNKLYMVYDQEDSCVVDSGLLESQIVDAVESYLTDNPEASDCLVVYEESEIRLVCTPTNRFDVTLERYE